MPFDHLAQSSQGPRFWLLCGFFMLMSHLHESQLRGKLTNCCLLLILFVVKSPLTHDCLAEIALHKTQLEGFPGGTVVESLPANAGDMGSSPGLGRSHMPWSNWAREPQLLNLCIWSLCSATREATIVRGPRTAMKSGPRLPQLEKALAQKRTPNTVKNKKLID